MELFISKVKKMKKKHDEWKAVALYKFSDRAAWEMAIEILENAGIIAGGDGGMGLVEITVDAKDHERALALLEKNEFLKGKQVDLDLERKNFLKKLADLEQNTGDAG